MVEYLFIFFNQTYKILLLLVPVLVSHVGICPKEEDQML